MTGMGTGDKIVFIDAMSVIPFLLSKEDRASIRLALTIGDIEKKSEGNNSEFSSKIKSALSSK